MAMTANLRREGRRLLPIISSSPNPSRSALLSEDIVQGSYRWLSSSSTSLVNSKLTFEDKFLPQLPQTSARWPNFLCFCSVFSSGSVQLHWSQWPPAQSDATPKWFSTSKGLLGAGPSGIMAADAIITEAGTLHVAGVPIVNPSTVVVWEVMPGPGNSLGAQSGATTTWGSVATRCLTSHH